MATHFQEETKLTIKDYDLTFWTSDLGIIRIRRNFNGAKYYLDIDNKYDYICNSKTELKEYLKNKRASFIGYESENDW